MVFNLPVNGERWQHCRSKSYLAVKPFNIRNLFTAGKGPFHPKLVGSGQLIRSMAIELSRGTVVNPETR